RERALRLGRHAAVREPKHRARRPLRAARSLPLSARRRAARAGARRGSLADPDSLRPLAVWNATIPYQGLEIVAAVVEVMLAFRIARRFSSGRRRILHAAWILAAIAAALAPPAYLLFLATDRWVSPVYAQVGTQFWAFAVVFPIAAMAR